MTINCNSLSASSAERRAAEDQAHTQAAIAGEQTGAAADDRIGALPQPANQSAPRAYSRLGTMSEVCRDEDELRASTAHYSDSLAASKRIDLAGPYAEVLPAHGAIDNASHWTLDSRYHDYIESKLTTAERLTGIPAAFMATKQTGDELAAIANMSNAELDELWRNDRRDANADCANQAARVSAYLAADELIRRDRKRLQAQALVASRLKRQKQPGGMSAASDFDD